MEQCKTLYANTISVENKRNIEARKLILLGQRHYILHTVWLTLYFRIHHCYLFIGGLQDTMNFSLICLTILGRLIMI